jgi:predicted Zn-dependent peptidase
MIKHSITRGIAPAARKTAAAERSKRSTASVSVHRDVLANGMAVLLVPRPHLKQSYACLYFGVGSRHETWQANGITHVLEHMLFRGTRSYKDATLLNAAAEDIGGFLEGATYRDHLMFATGCHPSALDTAVKLLGELVTTPRYLAMEVERQILREEVLEGLDADGRSIDIDNISHALIFGEHGLGMCIEGPLENLERVQVPDLEAHRQRFLVGNNAVVCVAGPLDVARTVGWLDHALGALPPGAAPLSLAPPPPQAEPIVRHVRDTGSQVDIRISFRGIPVHDRDHPGLVMLGRVLADGLASRMHAELVDRRGLAYALHAGPTTYGDCGLFEFEVAVAPRKAAEVVAAILQFAAAAPRFRFTAAELDRVRRRYRYGTEFMADSAADLASWHGRAALFAVETEMERLGAALAKVTTADIHAVARRVFRREGLVLTAVGELKRNEWREVRRIVEDWSGA